MIVIRQNEDTIEQGIVATIGFFDGVHVGHRFLIKELQDWGKELNMPSAVITFPEHPCQVLHSDYRPKLLDTFQEKMERLETTGIDYCIALDFTYELSLYSAADFIRLLAEEYHVKGLLIGYDHRFGHDRSDGFEQYVEYGGQVGMEVRKASPYDEENIRVSSSEIRRLLQEGKVEMANALLTYPYQLRGRIVSGYKVGRTIGFPTANIEVDSPYKLLPKVGVYAVWVELLGKRYNGLGIGFNFTISHAAHSNGHAVRSAHHHAFHDGLTADIYFLLFFFFLHEQLLSMGYYITIVPSMGGSAASFQKKCRLAISNLHFSCSHYMP